VSKKVGQIATTEGLEVREILDREDFFFFGVVVVVLVFFEDLVSIVGFLPTRLVVVEGFLLDVVFFAVFEVFVVFFFGDLDLDGDFEDVFALDGVDLDVDLDFLEDGDFDRDGEVDLFRVGDFDLADGDFDLDEGEVDLLRVGEDDLLRVGEDDLFRVGEADLLRVGDLDLDEVFVLVVRVDASLYDALILTK